MRSLNDMLTESPPRRANQIQIVDFLTGFGYQRAIRDGGSYKSDVKLYAPSIKPCDNRSL